MLNGLTLVVGNRENLDDPLTETTRMGQGANSCVGYFWLKIALFCVGANQMNKFQLC